MTRIVAAYRVRADAASIAARAEAIAVEQSVEMPLAAIDEQSVLEHVVGKVEDIADNGDGTFAVRIGLGASTIGADAGQLLNMAFGNTSLHEDVVLADLELPPELAAVFGGPRHGIAGLRGRTGAASRALTATALKPQGLPPARLAELAARFARGGIDLIKDDHGLADQPSAPFAERVPRIADAVRETGAATLYVPSLSGSLDDLRRQARQARAAGLSMVMLAPMIAGWSNMAALGREFPDLAILAHPTMGGWRIAPDLLIGRLLPLLGADAVIFPTHGGRFGYRAETCRRLAENARHPPHGQRPALPVPAGGMTLARVPELLDFYGPETMLLIGGSLLLAATRLTEETAGFVAAVTRHRYPTRRGDEFGDTSASVAGAAIQPPPSTRSPS